MCRSFAVALGVVFIGACSGPKGETGPAGANALATTSAEPPGAHCPTGGVKLDVGPDANGDGALEAAEVTSTSYVCGATGASTLVKTSDEPAGANCRAGGVKVEVGLDANGNGTLDASEVNASATRYVCNGAATSSLVRTSAEPAGANCAAGGVKVEEGVDTNGDGTLDASEVDAAATRYVCNGVGTVSLVATTPEAPGAHCPTGGVKIETGVDANGDGVLQVSEISAAATTFVCNAAPSGSVAPSTGVHVTVDASGVSVADGGVVSVRFRLTDDRGFPLDVAGRYSANAPMALRFSLSTFTVDGGVVGPLLTATRRENTPSSPTLYGGTATALVENGAGAGDYTYTFPSVSAGGFAGVAVDPARRDDTHVLWISASRQTDLLAPTNGRTFFAANQEVDFVPSGARTPAPRRLVTAAACDVCHAGFKVERSTADALHFGYIVDGTFCGVCHTAVATPGSATPAAVKVHRIHRGAKLQPANQVLQPLAVYPRDLRSCVACHPAGVAPLTPSIAACGSCHDAVAFDGSAAQTCAAPPALDAQGVPVPCNHFGGVAADGSCVTCHGPANVDAKHAPVLPPDPDSTWAGGSNPNTNAAFVAADHFVPAGASVITYDVQRVELLNDLSGIKRLSLTFTMKRDGVLVVFQDRLTATELLPDFIGTPALFFSFAVPQDGIAEPADPNVQFTVPLKSLWSGSGTGVNSGTLVRNTDGSYTAKLTGVVVPWSARLLTGAIGNGYFLTATPPLTQTNVPGYPLSGPVPPVTGGLIVPSRAAFQAAPAYGVRRRIVDSDKCDACHGTLGVAATFHGGQQGTAELCVTCHTPNRTSFGWGADAKTLVHALHASRMRQVAFTWLPGPPIGYPTSLDACGSCHVPGSWDYGPPRSTALPTSPDSLLPTTTATGVMPTTFPSVVRVSPYVIVDGSTSYGTGFSFTASSGQFVDAAPSTTISSPITAACVSCHDTRADVDHMTQNGGAFYRTRGQWQSAMAPEQCLICHGPGQLASVAAAHR
jgi:OmcA/MtrC family decaheme c-type cytochrome